MALEQPIDFQIDFGKLELEHLFDAIQPFELLFESAAAFPAEGPQSAPDRFQAYRVVIRRHARPVQQGHVAQLRAPVIDVLVVLEVAGDVADTDVEFEIVVADQRDTRRRQASGLLEALLLLRRCQLVVRCADFAAHGVQDPRVDDPALPGGVGDAAHEQVAAFVQDEEGVR